MSVVYYIPTDDDELLISTMRAAKAQAVARSTVLRGGYVLTFDRELGELASGDVLIEDDRIVAIARTLDVGDAEVVDVVPRPRPRCGASGRIRANMSGPGSRSTIEGIVRPHSATGAEAAMTPSFERPGRWKGMQRLLRPRSAAAPAAVRR